jgi:hypothetical protein
MRCTEGKPTFYLDWDKVTFPDQAVINISPVANPDAEPAEEGYVFQKSKDEDNIDHGTRASRQTSAKIIAAIGQAKYGTVTAHLTSGTKSVGIDVDGTQRHGAGWSDIVRSERCSVPRFSNRNRTFRVVIRM